MKDSASERAMLRHARLQTIALYAILLLLIAAAIFIALQFASLRSSIAELEAALPHIDAEKFTGLADSLRDTSEKLADINYTETVDALRDAAGTFSKIDVESLNALVNSLESVAERLQNAVNAIAGIFGR